MAVGEVRGGCHWACMGRLMNAENLPPKMAVVGEGSYNRRETALQQIMKLNRKLRGTNSTANSKEKKTGGMH